MIRKPVLRALVARAQALRSISPTSLQRVDVESGIGLVENRVLGCQDRQLQHLEPLFFTARETVVEITSHETTDPCRAVHLLEISARNFAGGQIARPLGLTRGVQKVRHLHARNRGRILEGEEESGAGPFIRCQRERCPRRRARRCPRSPRSADGRSSEKASVDLPLPLGPIRACTLPGSTVRSMPLRISLPSTLREDPRCGALIGHCSLRTYEDTS